MSLHASNSKNLHRRETVTQMKWSTSTKMSDSLKALCEHTCANASYHLEMVKVRYLTVTLVCFFIRHKCRHD